MTEPATCGFFCAQIPVSQRPNSPIPLCGLTAAGSIFNEDRELPEGHTYSDGVREGKLIALETMQAAHGARLDKVEGKISTLERVAYTLMGAIALVQFAPAIKAFLG